MKAVTCFMVLVVLVAPGTYSFVEINNFFPFGTANGDAQLPLTRGGFVMVPLGEHRVLNLFGSSHNYLFINTNGAISFNEGVPEFSPTCGASRVPMIIPFLADVDTSTGTGRVNYRQTADTQVLSRAESKIRKAFPNIGHLDLQWAFVATWQNVGFFGATANCGGINQRNTFQVVLTSDDQSRSFVIILYNDLTWTTSPAFKGNCYGRGGTSARAGFDYGDGLTFFDIGGSCTDTILSIPNTSNVNNPGQWVFRVDDDVQSPGCINRLQTEYEQLSITPSFMSTLGNVPITIKGRCLSDSSRIQIRFHDVRPITVNVSVPIGNTLTATVPTLNRNGRIKVELIVTRTGGTVQTFWGFIYTGKHEATLSFSRVNESNFEITWDKSNFDRHDLVDLELLEVAGGVWTSRGVVKENMENSGSFFGRFDNRGAIAFENLRNIYTVKLEVSPRSLQVNTSVSIDHPLIAQIMIDARSRSVAERDQICNAWHILNSNAPTDALACPPTLQQAQADQRFEEIIHLVPYNPDAQHGFIQRDPSPSGAGQRCVYRDGTLLVGPPSGGSVQSVSPNGPGGEVQHITVDLVPWFTCCYERLDSPSCALYFERRPSDDGTDYVCPDPACSIGDPHITTFDQIYYTFLGYGEFWFVKSTDGFFSMQGRTAPYIVGGRATGATVCVAYVMQQRNCKDIVTVQLELVPDGIKILLDGQLVAYDRTIPHQPKRTINQKGASIVIYSPKDVHVSFSSGFSFRFTDAAVVLNVVSFVDTKLRGKIRGLFGVYDGDWNNDLTAPDGTVYRANAPAAQIHEFGMKWIITAEETLFTYPFNKSYADFRDKEFEPDTTIPNLDDMPPEVVAACKGNVQCLFDYFITGNLEMALGTRDGIEEVNEIIDAFGIACRTPRTPENGMLEAANFLLGSTVRLACQRSFHQLIGNDMIRCERQESGILSWSGQLGICYNRCLQFDNAWDQYLCEIGLLP